MVGQVGWAGYDKACGWIEGNGIQYGAALGWPFEVALSVTIGGFCDVG